MKQPIETQDSREILNLIRQHNRWRRGDESLEMANPTELGHALDDVCNMIETQQRMIDMLHDQLTKAR